MTMTTSTPLHDDDGEPTEQGLRDLAAEHDIAIPKRPPLPLVRRGRYDDLSDDLAVVLVALAKAKADVRYWMGRFDAAHDRAAEAEERISQAEAEREKQRREDAPVQQPPAGHTHRTYDAAELAQHLEDECASCVATLPDQPDALLVEVAHTARDTGSVEALFLILKEVDRRQLDKASPTH